MILAARNYGNIFLINNAVARFDPSTYAFITIFHQHAVEMFFFLFL